jgi:hypothetical protein
MFTPVLFATNVSWQAFGLDPKQRQCSAFLGDR